MGKEDGAREFNIAIPDPKQRIQEFIDAYNDPSYNGHDTTLMKSIHLISAEKSSPTEHGEYTSRAIFSLRVLPALCNPMRNMHGGAVALLADMATTLTGVPEAEEGWWEFGGVTRTLAVTLISPIRMWTVVRVECKVRSVSSRLAMIQCLITDEESGKLLALGEHGKVALSTQTRRNKTRL